MIISDNSVFYNIIEVREGSELDVIVFYNYLRQIMAYYMKILFDGYSI